LKISLINHKLHSFYKNNVIRTSTRK